jgi:hypothetical protein
MNPMAAGKVATAKSRRDALLGGYLCRGVVKRVKP